MGFFLRRRAPRTDLAGLGDTLVAHACETGDVAPAGTTLLVFGANGQARRQLAGKVALAEAERAWCFHPGPYTLTLLPFAAAPEWGLQLKVVVDAANPRVAQQRFDLFLYSEVAQGLALVQLQERLQAALQLALAQGVLELAPCTTLEEWHAFRAGFNQLLYTRFGLTVDDCVPIDLAPQADYAAQLRARAVPVPVPTFNPIAGMPAEAPAHVAAAASAVSAVSAVSAIAASHVRPDAQADARGLRRLFLELPALSSGLRLLEVPAGADAFAAHQALLLRLGMASLNVQSMPTLGWSAPDQALPLVQQQRRIGHTLLSLQALDEGWSLLAQWQRSGNDTSAWRLLHDQADRVCANLETGLAGRRQPYPPEQEDGA